MINFNTFNEGLTIIKLCIREWENKSQNGGVIFIKYIWNMKILMKQ